MSDNDPIANALNLTPIEIEKPRVVQEKKQPSLADNDFEYARTNLYDIIEKGQEALIGILDVANMSQHPRSYEVAANLIKTLSEVNKDLLVLAKTKQELETKTQEDQPKNQTINNNLFVGSTSELQKMLKKNELIK